VNQRRKRLILLNSEDKEREIRYPLCWSAADVSLHAAPYFVATTGFEEIHITKRKSIGTPRAKGKTLDPNLVAQPPVIPTTSGSTRIPTTTEESKQNAVIGPSRSGSIAVLPRGNGDNPLRNNGGGVALDGGESVHHLLFHRLSKQDGKELSVPIGVLFIHR